MEQDLTTISNEVLRDMHVRGMRTLNALAMADLADHRVMSHYEPYAPDAYPQLDRNFARIEKLRSALRRVAEELERRKNAHPR